MEIKRLGMWDTLLYKLDVDSGERGIVNGGYSYDYS